MSSIENYPSQLSEVWKYILKIEIQIDPYPLDLYKNANIHFIGNKPIDLRKDEISFVKNTESYTLNPIKYFDRTPHILDGNIIFLSESKLVIFVDELIIGGRFQLRVGVNIYWSTIILISAKNNFNNISQLGYKHDLFVNPTMLNPNAVTALNTNISNLLSSKILFSHYG
ncbi:hypothetical protein HZS_3086, partial [Henneguya salminicola]